MDIINDIKAKWDDLLSGNIVPKDIRQEYYKNENIHVPVRNVSDMYYKLKANREKIEQEVVSKIKGTFILEVGSIVIKNNVEVVTPPIYFEYTTKANLLLSLNSELWNCDDIVSDMQGELTWTNYLKTL